MNCVATIATHDKSNQITNNSNRIACSHNDGDCPRGDLLRLTATSFGTFSFEATAATVSACESEPFGEGDMVDRSNQSLMQHEAASLPNVPECRLRSEFRDLLLTHKKDLQSKNLDIKMTCFTPFVSLRMHMVA